MLKRRQFLRYLGSTASGLMLSQWAIADDDDDDHHDRKDGSRKNDGKESGSSTSNTDSNQVALATTAASGRVVVIGGGMAGATVAKYLRLWGGARVEVTLVEREPRYLSNILSNLVLTGQTTLDKLTFKYDLLRSRYGINVVQGDVVQINPLTRNVTFADGKVLGYDRLVVAPGIDFDTVPGLESEAAQLAVPHAWKAGPQTDVLRDQIRAMNPGGLFVMSIPKAPYRCPPGPYERACVVADYLKRNKPGAKVLVLDENDDIIAEKKSFSYAFNTIHAGVIAYEPAVSIRSVDAASRTAYTNIGAIRGDVLNVIPAQRAGKLVHTAGLANVSGRWAGVDVLSYESTGAVGIHIIGDAAATTQPKAGHIANQEAKVCADAIVRGLMGQAPDQKPVTNSACYSPITSTTASWLTAVFAYDPLTRTMKVVPGASGEADTASTKNFKQMSKWFGELMLDSFA